MNLNYFEELIVEQLRPQIQSGALRISLDSNELFKKLRQCFPVTGSKINWSKLSGSISQVAKDADSEIADKLNFFHETCVSKGLVGEILVAGDSAIDFVITGDLAIVGEQLKLLLEVPQHLYLFPKNFSWCFCFTMEGEMSFGTRQS